MTAGESGTSHLDLRVGDLVEVRDAAEILATLDENGELDSLPFMPEMLQYCGKRLTVYKVAHKACDTLTRSGIRRMDNAVHLTGVRCDGGGHGGCQAACLIYWKHAWLRKVDADEPAAGAPTGAPTDGEARLLPLVTAASRRAPAEDGGVAYRCQATELLRAAPEGLPFRQFGQFTDDVRSGNVSVFWALRALLVGFYNRWQGASVRHLPPWMRIRGGRHWGTVKGTAAQTPSVNTNLQPGDTVRIRSRRQIASTLNANLLNRGMGFDAEMGRFCGRTAQVERRVTRIIDEHTGKMIEMRNPCIVLEGLICEGAYNANCPRSITPYWREIWLEKVGSAGGGVAIPRQRDRRANGDRTAPVGDLGAAGTADSPVKAAE